MDPLSFAARITSSFALGCLKPKSRVLDVGSGDGAIAASMLKGGLEVTAIDSNEAAVEKTRAKGVDCILSTLEKFESEPFDAIICSRSLHHIQPLDRSMATASKLLKPGGLLLVDDFGYERVDQKTASWLFNLAELLAIGKENSHHGWLTAGRKEKTILGPGHELSEALTIWRKHFEVDHHVTSFERVKNALLDHFEIMEERSVPYLFHYLCDLLPGTKSGADQASAIYNWEREMAQVGGIEMCGVRLIARKA